MSTSGVYGMTQYGFKPKRLRDILDSTEAKISTIQDPKTGEYVFENENQDSILGQANAIICEAIAECWEQAYSASVQYDPLYSFGAPLRGLVQLNGIVPSYGTATQITLQLTGVVGTLIPAGSQASDINANTIFVTNSDAVIGSNGSITVTATCSVKGDVIPDNNTIIQILTPIFGWHNVTNTQLVVAGTNADTDTQLKVKQQRGTANTSYSQVDALYSGIEIVPDVKYVRIYQNVTTETDDRGLPGKTIAAVIDGGDPDVLGNVIWLKAPMLSNYAGNLETPITKYDKFGLPYIINFYRPEQVPVYIDLDITITDNSLWPSDGEEQIINNIINYAAYGLNSSNGFPPGNNVIYSRLYTPINEVPGFKVNHLYIGTSENPTETSDITISWLQVAQFLPENIVISQANSRMRGRSL